VRDAAFAHKHSLDRGAWDMPTRRARRWSSTPGIHGVGESLIYFVDRYTDLSIYDVDFVYLKNVDKNPKAIAACTGSGSYRRSSTTHADWLDFYENLFGFSVLPRGQYFGVLPKGTLSRAPVTSSTCS